MGSSRPALALALEGEGDGLGEGEGEEDGEVKGEGEGECHVHGGDGGDDGDRLGLGLLQGSRQALCERGFPSPCTGAALVGSRVARQAGEPWLCSRAGVMMGVKYQRLKPLQPLRRATCGRKICCTHSGLLLQLQLVGRGWEVMTAAVGLSSLTPGVGLGSELLQFPSWASQLACPEWQAQAECPAGWTGPLADCPGSHQAGRHCRWTSGLDGNNKARTI